MSKTQTDFIYKTVLDGPFIVLNVPHARYSNGQGADGEEYYFPASVLCKLSKIISKMRLNGSFEDDYSLHKH